MTASYRAAFAHDTTINKTWQAKIYLSFMMTYNYDCLDPSIPAVLLFTQFLANSYKSPLTVKNYLSGAKSYVTSMGGNTANFTTPILHNLLKGITRLSNHIPAQAPPIPLHFIKALCDALYTLDDNARTIRTAVLMGFTSLLRQSNLLECGAPTRHHLIRRMDVRDEGDTLWLDVNSSKTIIDPARRVSVPLPRIRSPYCPVAAWRDYAARSPAPLDAPIFTLPGGIPLTIDRVTFYIRTILAQLGHPAPATVTFHSLRRSGARECARHGATEPDLMLHGTWTMNAITTYVPKRLYTNVREALTKVLGQ